ncbi:putative glucuronosyltransferase PGSIP6 [Morella rubra]|uniref:Hexosyltransferase n=1 Tax=Morella rubra TaxID=262757 RepID=A0A6A1UR11_9ROSI|nr:putative glucuronosyltransferase PGSIP6 [Morella rubra]
MRRLTSLWVLLLLVLISIQSKASLGSQPSAEAYVTLLYGDEFLLGVRVLGKSIRDTKSKKDLVVLVSDGVSDYAKKLLQADGWIVEKISLLVNPNQVRPKRFWGVYTKLKIFNMTNYKKVVYLDADTIVVQSIEDLFKCGKFCANLKHSERLNSGVMVLEPSETLFNDMMRKVNTLYSYTGGDQGFLNSYYPGFPNAHVFEPNLPPEVVNSRPVPEMQRLSTLYNADVGLYMLANKWMLSYYIFMQTRESFGSLCRTSLCDRIRHLYYRLRSGGSLTYTGVSTSSSIGSSHQFSNGTHSQVPIFLGGISVVVCFMAAVVSLAFALAIVPRQVLPWTGLLLMYEWIITLFILFFGGYLHLIYLWGKTTATQAGSLSSNPEAFDYDSGKGPEEAGGGEAGGTGVGGIGKGKGDPEEKAALLN